jgi:hypothetical protein
LNGQIECEAQAAAAIGCCSPAYGRWPLVFIHIVKVINFGTTDDIENFRMVVSGWGNKQPSLMQDTAELPPSSP